jgi:hypothetical protein
MDKPECRKCGERHWMFVACAEAEARNELEQENAQAAVAARVIPQHRTKPARSMATVSRNYIEQAPGVYRRRRSHTDA